MVSFKFNLSTILSSLTRSIFAAPLEERATADTCYNIGYPGSQFVVLSQAANKAYFVGVTDSSATIFAVESTGYIKEAGTTKYLTFCSPDHPISGVTPGYVVIQTATLSDRIRLKWVNTKAMLGTFVYDLPSPMITVEPVEVSIPTFLNCPGGIAVPGITAKSDAKNCKGTTPGMVKFTKVPCP